MLSERFVGLELFTTHVTNKISSHCIVVNLFKINNVNPFQASVFLRLTLKLSLF